MPKINIQDLSRRPILFGSHISPNNNIELVRLGAFLRIAEAIERDSIQPAPTKAEPSRNELIRLETIIQQQTKEHKRLIKIIRSNEAEIARLIQIIRRHENENRQSKKIRRSSK